MIDIEYKKFEMKSNLGDIRYGIIAQDLIKINPELVYGIEGNYKVKYIDLLIYEVNYLKSKIKELENKIK